MDAFSYLPPAIRQFIYEENWKKLRPIQTAAIRLANETPHHFILAAPTASGKTEAAFFAALSTISDWHGVKIVLVSPLIALINDQFLRVRRFCEKEHIPVTAWHGEAKASGKTRLLKNPSGILLITPESLEGMLATHPERATALFAGTEWIFTDELHAFLGNSRGMQLRSLLQRICFQAGISPRFIGMSATLSKENFEDLKHFFPQTQKTVIAADLKKRSMKTDASFHEREGKLLNAIFRDAVRENMLIFPNSRKRVEEIAAGLHSYEAPIHVFAHHSSVEKELRKEAEFFARSGRGHFSIVATSTLELGVDIGSVDSITQVEAPSSVSQLSQRMGRSGRGEHVDEKTGKVVADSALLHFHATEPFSYLQGITAISLLKEGRMDAVMPIKKPYDVYAHQLLSMVLQGRGRNLKQLMRDMHILFPEITPEEGKEIVRHLLRNEILEAIGQEIIIGLLGERIVTSHFFYALFTTVQEYAVLFGKERIGKIPYQPYIVQGHHLLLSGKIWEVVGIDHKRRSISVEPSRQGQAPKFGGSGMEVSHLLRRNMLSVLRKSSAPALLELKEELTDQPIQFYGKDLLIFLGTRMERTLYLYLRYVLRDRKDIRLDWNPMRFCLSGKDLKSGLGLLQPKIPLQEIAEYLVSDEDLLQGLTAHVKFAYLVPPHLLGGYVVENLCDPGLEKYLAVFLDE